MKGAESLRVLSIISEDTPRNRVSTVLHNNNNHNASSNISQRKAFLMPFLAIARWSQRLSGRGKHAPLLRHHEGRRSSVIMLWHPRRPGLMRRADSSGALQAIFAAPV